MYNQPHPKSIAIFCSSLVLGQEPLTKDYYWQSYQDLLFALKARGIRAYFTTGNHTYLGGGRFKVAYTTNRKLADPKLLKPVRDVTVDAIFERSEYAPFSGTDIPVINPDSLRRIANNKIAIYENFAAFQPQSRIVNTEGQLRRAVSAMAGDKVVVKEPEGFGGSSVYIGDKTDVLLQVPTDRYPLLVQEFLDTSAGVPGYEPGVHDMRVKICGGEIIGCYIRIAQTGTYHSNVLQGGKIVYVPLENVPARLRTMVAKIDRKFTGSPRYYAADFSYTPKGWKLIELNDYIGLNPVSDGPEAVKTLDRLADYLVQACAPVLTPVTLS